MIAAKLLSSTALSVSEISERIGYKDTSDFYRAFKKTHGVSPTCYRSFGKTADN
jgi:AraC-like DNA-binding protein